MTSKKVLLIGYGNPGRLDDGLGPALAQAIDDRSIPGVTVDIDYQLLVEDAAAVAEYDVVIFVDASVSGKEPFSFRSVEASEDITFTTHSMKPESVVALAEDMFGQKTQAYTLAIRGYEFNDFGEKLSEQAAANLESAISFVEGVIQNNLYSDAASAIG